MNFNETRLLNMYILRKEKVHQVNHLSRCLDMLNYITIKHSSDCGLYCLLMQTAGNGVT